MKHFKLSKKSLMSFALSAIMLLSMSSMAMLCYAWDHPTTNAFNVTLYEDQKRTYSGALVDPCICFEGKNSCKLRAVLFKPQYSRNNQASWTTDTKNVHTVPKGEFLEKQVSSYDANKPWWRLCLENDSTFSSGATAYGWCW